MIRDMISKRLLSVLFVIVIIKFDLNICEVPIKLFVLSSKQKNNYLTLPVNKWFI